MVSYPQKYKFVYLSNFVINAILIISILTIQWLDLCLPKAKEWLESWICFWGITMILSLWSKAFIATPLYKGNKVLNSRITKLFAFSLFMIEAITLYSSLYKDNNFIIPLTICMVIWSLVFIWSTYIRHEFIISNIDNHNE